MSPKETGLRTAEAAATARHKKHTLQETKHHGFN